jgi:YlmC/YmxH family sporulation protein
MRWSEFSDKEIIDLYNGERLGIMGNADLTVHPETGRIETIIVPPKSIFSFKTRRYEIIIPWRAVRKIGPDMVIVENLQKGVMKGE